jgi:tetratricopeptide (TPR) repeat protein
MATPRPPPVDNVSLVRARAHFDAGNAHYAAGRYPEAIREFQAGHALVPRPSFLLNLGQAYRKIGDLDHAKDAYVAYVRSLPDDSPLRDQAMRVLAEIELQTSHQADAHPEANPHPPEVNPPLPIAPAVPGDAPPRAHTGAGRWIGIGLASAGVALLASGTLFELRAKSASDELSDLDRRRGVFDAGKDRVGRRDETVGMVLLAAGGLATVTGVSLFFALRRDGSGANASDISSGRGSHLALAPAFAPDGRPFAFALTGRF